VRTFNATCALRKYALPDFSKLVELSQRPNNHAVAARCWDLRHSLTIYDAAFVAMAEATQSPLYTLDKRLAAASGPSCEFVTPTEN
jgi:predicted nucleic acid-binding protein